MSEVIQPGAIFTDSRHESETWYVKYADDEVVVSRNTEDRYHRYERREHFERACGLAESHSPNRFSFTGDTIGDEEEQHTEQTEATQTKSIPDL